MAGKIKLNKDEVRKLKARVDTWPTLSREEREREREAFITDFITCRGDDSADEWRRESLRGKVVQWFSNNAAPSQSRLPGLLKTTWTPRQVFNERMAGKISVKQAKLLKKATEAGESMRDIVALNKARMMVWNKLSQRKKDKFKEEAARWTAEGPDPLSKLEVIEKRVPAWVDSFAGLLYDQANVMAQITFCHVDAQGQVVETSYDISDSWHRQEKKTLQYTKVYPNWQRSFPDSFVRFCRRVLCPEEEFEDDEAVIPKPRAKAEPVELDEFPEGDPILPSLDEVQAKQLSRQATIRRFFNAHYALACGVSGVPVPWNTLVGNNAKFLTPHSVVENCTIQDPSRMPKPVLDAVWEHILDLQTRDDPDGRFWFAKWYDAEAEEFFEAKYDGRPAEKKMQAATKKNPKGGPPPSNPWHVDRLPAGDSRAGQGGPAPTRAGPLAAGGRSQAAPARNNPQPQARRAKDQNKGKPTQPGRSLKAKGKAPAKDDSDSAESSSEEDDSDSDPPLHSEGSPDVFDFDQVGGLRGEDVSSSSSSSSSHAGGPSRSAAIEVNGASPSTAGLKMPQQPASAVLAPAVDVLNPWAIEAALFLPQEPNSTLVAAAKYQPPAWVGHIAERVFPFLWALAGEAPYRALLTGWRHMLTRRASFKESPIGDWANWDYSQVALPPVIHGSGKTWDRFLTWIQDAAPRANTTASDVQRWFLVLGMAIRDTHMKNATEDDEPVPNNWPEYMRSSPAELPRDVIQRLEPFLASVYCPLPKHSAPRPRAVAQVVSRSNDGGPSSRHPSTSKHPSPRSTVSRRSGESTKPTQHGPRLGASPALLAASLIPESIPDAGPGIATGPHPARKHGGSNDQPAEKGKTQGLRKKGPPGIPATSMVLATARNISRGSVGSVCEAEGEEAVGGREGVQRPIGIPTGGPRSISEGLAAAQTSSDGLRSRPVPYVLIESTIADRLKRRRNQVGPVEPVDDENDMEEAPQGKRGPPRRSLRPTKRRKVQ